MKNLFIILTTCGMFAGVTLDSPAIDYCTADYCLHEGQTLEELKL